MSIGVINRRSSTLTSVAPAAGKREIVFARTSTCYRHNVLDVNADIAIIESPRAEYVDKLRTLHCGAFALFQKPINSRL
jgi:hypothetical protein